MEEIPQLPDPVSSKDRKRDKVSEFIWWLLRKSAAPTPILSGTGDEWTTRINNGGTHSTYDLIHENGSWRFEKVAALSSEKPSNTKSQNTDVFKRIQALVEHNRTKYGTGFDCERSEQSHVEASGDESHSVSDNTHIRFFIEDSSDIPTNDYLFSLRKTASDMERTMANWRVWVRDRSISTGFLSLMWQWSSSQPASWWELSSFHHSSAAHDESYHTIQGALRFTSDLVLLARRVLILETDDDVPVFFISFRRFQLSTKEVKPLSLISCSKVSPIDGSKAIEAFWNTFSDLKDAYVRLLAASPKPSTTKKITLLWYCHAALIDWSVFIADVRLGYSIPRQQLLNARTITVDRLLLSEMRRDSRLYLEFDARIKHLTSTINSLVEVVEACIKDPAYVRKSPSPNGLHHLHDVLADLRGLCRGIESDIDVLKNELDHQTRDLETSRGVKESRNILILTLLASIFLPLNLASSLLSMGSRFKDLGPKLYDFCGVAMILMTLAFVILNGVRFLMWANEWITRVRGHGRSRNPRLTHIANVLAWGAVMAARGYMQMVLIGVVLSSFLVGMLRDMDLGGQLLGWGLFGFALLGLPIALLFASMPVVWEYGLDLYLRYGVRRRTSQRPT